MTRKKIVIGITAGLVVVVGGLAIRGRGQQALSVVQTEMVKRVDLVSRVVATGQIRPKKEVNISANIPGKVVELNVVEGQEVKAGQLLLRIDPAQYQAEVRRGTAAVEATHAELQQASASYKRAQQTNDRQRALREQGLVAQEDLDRAATEMNLAEERLRSAEAAVRQAGASLQIADDALAKTTITSPFDGIVTSLKVEEGEVAVIGTMNNPGTVLLTVADPGIMETEVKVDETDVVNISIGQKAQVTVDALPGKKIEGEVTEIGSSAISSGTATAVLSEEAKDFKVVVTLKDPPAELKSGLSATAEITTAAAPAVLAAPYQALVIRDMSAKKTDLPSSYDLERKRDELEGVFIVRDGKVAFSPLKTGIKGDILIEATDGLKEGDEIVIGPHKTLRTLKNGDAVKVDNTTPADKKTPEENA